MSLHAIPELVGNSGSIRIPELRSVPLTRRIGQIVDHPAFQRLRRVRQLGPTHLVYPGAVHTRFEHSLGVFDMSRQYLSAILRDANAAVSVTEADVHACLLAGLLHDIGHYPFAHSLEALHIEGYDTPRHEDLSEAILLGDTHLGAGGEPIAAIIDREFACSADEVISLIRNKPKTHASPTRRLVASIISSGVDADKADYLERDSVHMGVSYGRNYDRARFLSSLRPNLNGDAIAVSDKGKVAAEIFIFCRYTMFSEAYWHHTVRSASAMVEAALTDFQAREQPDNAHLVKVLLSRSDDAFLEWLVDTSPEGTATRALLSLMSGGQRSLYKRVLTLNRVYDDIATQSAYDRIYQLDGSGRIELAGRIRARLGELVGKELAEHEMIIDTPPRDKDTIETVDVVFGGAKSYKLPEISKVVQGISTDFIKVVKKIRVFVHPWVRDALRSKGLSETAREAMLATIADYEPPTPPQQKLF